MWLEYQAARLIYFVSNLFLQTVRRFFFGSPICKNPKTILIYRTGHLGDTLCAIPAIKAVRESFPNAHLILMTNAEKGGFAFAKEILEPVVHFDEVIVYDPAKINSPNYIRGLCGNLRKKRIDFVFYLSGNTSTVYRLLREMFFFKLCGCKGGVGFRLALHRFFKLAQRKFHTFDPEPLRFMKLVNQAGVSGELKWDIPRASFQIPSTGQGPIVAVHPGANFPVKKWPIERFIEVCRRLQDEHGAHMVIIGGESANAEAEALSHGLNGKAVNLSGKTTILETAEVLRQSRFLLSNDSGPVHLAAAVGTPVVALFSAREYPNVWVPIGEKHQVFRKDVPCQICDLKVCPIMICINHISSAEVYEACKGLLEESR